jgi:hypothetical protein
MAKAGTTDRRARIERWGFTGVTMALLGQWGDPLTILGWLSNPVRVTSGGDGDVYVVDELMRVQRFRRDGRAVGQLSLPGLREADADAAGDVYVVRHRYGSSDEDPTDPEVPPAGTHKIIVERLHFEGGFVSGREESSPATTVWSDSWVEPRSTGPMSQVAAVEVDSARERVYVLDAGLRKVRVYATDGTAYPEIDLPDLGAGFPEYTDLAVGSDGSCRRRAGDLTCSRTATWRSSRRGDGFGSLARVER